jgi:hypothetical protein
VLIHCVILDHTLLKWRADKVLNLSIGDEAFMYSELYPKVEFESAETSKVNYILESQLYWGLLAAPVALQEIVPVLSNRELTTVLTGKIIYLQANVNETVI